MDTKIVCAGKNWGYLEVFLYVCKYIQGKYVFLLTVPNIDSVLIDGISDCVPLCDLSWVWEVYLC